MAETLPNARYLESQMRYSEHVQVNELQSGAAKARRIGKPTWIADIATAPLSADELGEWEVFLMLHGSSKSVVKIFPPNQCTPKAYYGFAGVDAASGGQFSGAGNLFSRVDAYNFQLNECPSLFELRAGDWVGFEKDDRFSLHRVVANTTGDAAGNVTIQVEPAVPARFDAGSDVRFEKPVGEFLIQANSVARQKVGRKTSIRFSAKSRAE